MLKKALLLGCITAVAAMTTSCLLPGKNIDEGAGSDGTLTEENNLLGNSQFTGKTYLPWTTSFTSPGIGAGKIVDGAFCVEVENKGVNNWDAQFRHREMVIQRGHRYYLQFDIWATQDTEARPKVGMAGPPYAEYWFENIKLKTKPQTFSASFVMTAKDDPTAEFAFHIGGGLASGATEPYSVCIDNVVMMDAEFKKQVNAANAPIPNILVNQTGYYPQLSKIATVKTAATSPLDWEIVDGANKTLAKGQTIVYGPDKASGDTVHVIDFTSFASPGKGYKIKVGEDVSHPFDIRKDIYSKMKYDALHFFYHQRQGINIEMPYAEDKKYTHLAGHPGDVSVGCLPKAQYYGTKTPYEGCNYKLDVSQGWYDAGDHGKYVVNGGATVWSLLNQYERGKYLGTTVEDFGDGKVNIPENKNGVPDILDEVRWEMEFFLKMQIPEGKPKAGLVHHKIADEQWTMLAIDPSADTVSRSLHPPTTTATLNMAATAAMAARIWEKFDPAFSKKCLEAAEKAWAAAHKYPDEWASSDAEHGSGPYDDDKIDDETYWAAAELFITTGKDEYKKVVTESRFFKNVPSFLEYDKVNGTFTWKDIAPPGSISLATVPNKLSKEEVDAIRKNVVKAGDEYLAVINGEGYRLPLTVKDDGQYPWGANSNVLNALQVIGLAYDFSKDKKFIDGVAVGMDYIMGRNAMDTSYVTGYGTRPVKNPHHRFWAHQMDQRFPEPPPGVVSGGPNSGIQDPVAKAAGLEGCAPMKCYIDNIESWSTNEITINWNAPLSWVAAFLDETAGK
jgi:endoglucanase